MLENDKGVMVATRDIMKPSLACYVPFFLPGLFFFVFDFGLYVALFFIVAIVGGKVMSGYGYRWRLVWPLIQALLRPSSRNIYHESDYRERMMHPERFGLVLYTPTRRKRAAKKDSR